AHDHFLPSPLTKRGRRLVFANGIVVLAGLATVVTIIFGASVSHLIPINGIGAVATLVVGIVIAVTTFTHGAWIIMIIVPVTVAVLVRVNKHYDHVATKLDEPDPALAIATSNRLGAVVMVSRVDDGLDRAMRYVDHL